MRTPPKKGDRVRVIAPLEDPAPLPVGAQGVVDHVFEHEGWFQVSVVWEESVESRKLMLLDIDPYEVVT